MLHSPKMCRQCPRRRSNPDRDAIIVPTSRAAFCLQPAINLAARLDVLLVVLCSKQTRADHMAERVSSSPRGRALIVDLPKTWRHPNFPTRTSNEVFRKANGYPESDLSAKRNIGLLLARLHVCYRRS